MRTLKIHLIEAKYEFLKLFRLPAYVIPTLAFPMMFYILFGLGLGKQKVSASVTMAKYMLGTYGTFGVIAAALFGFGVSVAAVTSAFGDEIASGNETWIQAGGLERAAEK